jgi:prepilin-type N-terminal cleavage/methylation domain-containing protein
MQQKGFTLIELMIVVGIIGILVAIAAPNFSRYQSKARQSEAKIILAAVYSGEKSFYSEYSAYVGSHDAIGYFPEGQRRYYAVGWAAVHAAQPINGYTGDYGNFNFTELLNPFTCTTNTTPALAAALSGDAQTFIVNASGCIRDTQSNLDRWSINDDKVLQNFEVSL